MSNFAFGTYRITDKNPQHIQALREAIEAGIRLIDTSTNYMDGSSERAVALALRSFDEDRCNEIEIVSKFGYIQGNTLKRHQEEAFEDTVEYSENCFHSISASFMKDQLEKSLSRLELKKIDCYLIHNPEYYIYDALKRGISSDDMLDNMFSKIFDVFVGFEEEIRNGKIGSYGISSNSFSKPETDVEFLPYEDLVTLAIKAAKYVGNDKHSFTTIELPINILETEGLKCASWAKKNGLRVLVNRPLNAQKDELMFRLADYEESREYYHHLNELFDVCNNDELRPLYNLLEQLDENKHKFSWIGDYDDFLYSQIIPHIKKNLDNISKNNLDTILKYIDMFLIEYRKMVAYECCKHTKVKLKDTLDFSSFTLQESALKFLMQKDTIDYILIGMRKPSYVQDVMSLKI